MIIIPVKYHSTTPSPQNKLQKDIMLGQDEEISLLLGPVICKNTSFNEPPNYSLSEKACGLASRHFVKFFDFQPPICTCPTYRPQDTLKTMFEGPGATPE